MTTLNCEEDNNSFTSALRCENCEAVYYTMDSFAFHAEICPLNIKRQELEGKNK